MKFTIGFIINARRYIPGIAGTQYFGNALMYGHVTMTLKELIDTDLSMIVYKIRSEVNSFSENEVKSILKKTTHVYKQGSLEEYGNPYHPLYGFVVSNWSAFNLYKGVKLNDKVPEKASAVVPMFVPWMNYIVPLKVGVCQF